MATVNNASVREEFAKIKSTFDELRQEGKISSEVNMLFKSMLMLVDLIFAIFLEKTTQKTSRNSSKPSSQTTKDDSSLSSAGTNGKGKSIKDQAADNMRTVETVTIAHATTCECCGENLTKVTTTQFERRTKIDIVFEKVIEHVDAEIKICPNCHAHTKASFPSDMNSPLQYGVGIKAYIINLIICQMLSLKRLQTLMQSMFVVVIAEATMLKFVLKLHAALAGWEAQAFKYLLRQQAMHVDETSLRVDKKNQWIHVYSAGDITLKCLHPQRGDAAIKEFNIIPQYTGVIIHDCWASYFAYKHCGHGLCGSHLLRELTFVIDSNDYAWAKEVKSLLQETNKKVSTCEEKKLSNEEYFVVQTSYRDIIARGEKELPVIPPRTNGKRGKIAKSDAHNLWERLKEHENAVLLFAKNAHVAFTNNRAERDLRMAKVKQKISGCFRRQIYAKAYCRISSYLQSMANKGVNPLVAIQMALAGNYVVEGCE